MPSLSRLESISLNGKRVLVRLPESNSSWCENPHYFTSLFQTVRPTLELILQRGGRILLLGTQKKAPPDKDSNALKIWKDDCQKIFKHPLQYLIEQELQQGWEGVPPDAIALYIEWRDNEKEGIDAPKLATLCDIYVNEARTSSQQAQELRFPQLAKLVPAYAGLGLYRELEFFQNLLIRPRQEIHLILGGIGLEEKFDFLEKLFEKTLAKASTIIWYGTLGVNETPEFHHANQKLATFLRKSKARVCIIGEDTSATFCATNTKPNALWIEPNSAFIHDILHKRTIPDLETLLKDDVNGDS